MKRVLTRAYANIALCKYWGKMPGDDNLPATPSISLTLRELYTDTEVTIKSKGPDCFRLNGKKPDENTTNRLNNYLCYWRKRGLLEGNFEIKSRNSFPTKSGMASSSSGYAALASALSEFSRKKISIPELSRLARYGSGSAARSVTGGLSCLPLGKNPAARQILIPDEIPWGMVIATIESGEKKIGSRRGMQLSRETSPYFKEWLRRAKCDYKDMLAAVADKDFSKIGKICEADTLAMHACMISTRPTLLYWSPATIELAKQVMRWREEGLEGYFTMDAGAQVMVFARRKDLRTLAGKAAKINGVINTAVSLPAGGAFVMERE